MQAVAYSALERTFTDMKKQNTFTGFLLIAVGGYFLLNEWKLPFITGFNSWTTLLMFIGIALLLHSYTTKDYQHLFTGTFLLGLGIHLHGVNHYDFWVDHWAVYPLIIGIAFIVRGLRTKKGTGIGFLFMIGSLLFIFSPRLPESFHWLQVLTHYISRFWPVIIIVVGFYLLKRKK